MGAYSRFISYLNSLIRARPYQNPLGAMRAFADNLYTVVPGLTYGTTHQISVDPAPLVYAPDVGGEKVGEIYLASDRSSAWIWGASGWVGLSGGTGGGSTYVLPIASPSTLGGIKVGTGLSIDGSGVLSTTSTAVPGGSNTQVQFNDGGVFGGDAGLTYVKATDALTSGTFTSSSAGGTSFTANTSGVAFSFPLGASLYSAGIYWIADAAGWYTGGKIQSLLPSANANSFLLNSTNRINFRGGVAGNHYLTSLTNDNLSTPGTFTAGSLVGPLTGNASTATALNSTGSAGQFWANNNTWQTPPVTPIFPTYDDDDGPIVGTYREVTGGTFPSAMTWWTDSGKTVKVKETLISRNADQSPSVITYNFYTAGVLVKTLTDTITYTGVVETSRARSIT